jgi:hypothetical protein
MRHTFRRFTYCVVPFCAATLSGCASLELQPVKAWERGTLAKPEMQFAANPGLDRALYKTFAAKEAGQGSGSAGGVKRRSASPP